VSDETPRYLASVKVPLLVRECARNVVIPDQAYNVPGLGRPSRRKNSPARHAEAQAQKQGRGDPALHGINDLVRVSQ